MKIAFVSGSRAKYGIAAEHLAPFGVELEHVNLDLVEIQSPSVQKIADHKARQAFQILGRELIVEDSSFAIDELAGFPGTNVKQLITCAGAKAVAHLADLTSTRACTSTAALVYIDAAGAVHSFTHSRQGTIAAEPQGDADRLALWTVYCPPGSALPLAAIPHDEYQRWQDWWATVSVFAQFGHWLTSASNSGRDAADDNGCAVPGLSIAVHGGAVEAATALVAEMFPDARWAVLSGSVITTQRTPGSDLDILVRLSDNPGGVAWRRSLRWQGWPAEVFGYDTQGLRRYLAKDLAGGRPVLHRMLATGVLIAGHDDAEVHRLRAQYGRALRAGPQPMTPEESGGVRYRLTGLLDDLTYATDPGEIEAIRHAVWVEAAQLHLRSRRHWIGTGKWLWREMLHCDPGTAHSWLAARLDPAPFARRVLERAGGPVFDGFTLVESDLPESAPEVTDG